MKISYNWLNEYLPQIIEPEKLSKILTSLGLEVESLEKFEEIKGGLKGLIIGEVIECSKHSEADKLKLTKVDTGNGKTLQIVCGAPNVAVTQKVVVATPGCTIHPIIGEPITIKKVKIRGVESNGMICAEDEIGLGESHEGIMVLPNNVETGTAASEYFKPYTDWIFEIGLTPNRMDAMSHLGVAKDVCAYLFHQNKKEISLKSPFKNNFKADNQKLSIEVVIKNTEACQRYSGVSIANIKVEQSPKWLQQKLKSIGQRSVNNIVDITNYILHETGQPLHAFDADEINSNLPAGNKGKIIVKNLPEATQFITLDEKERKLHADDLMICNGMGEPMCIGGVFGGLHSGVKQNTTNIFLESAWFHPAIIRKTSLRHDLRTDSSVRFERGVDISNTVNVLKRAAIMIKEIAGGEISSDIIDIYPNPKQKTEIILKNHYLKKISGKNYHADTVKNILQSLGFEILKEGMDDIRVAVPFSKHDITLPADVIEEIMRIDGYDNVEIPSSITISPAIETNEIDTAYREKIANYLAGSGFSEIFTNSITNSKYYKEKVLKNSVRILNNLSADIDIMKPGLLETGLECIAYNLNRKNNDLLFFEFGKSYSTSGAGNYNEEDHLCLYVSGNKNENSWRSKPQNADFYFVKGICENIFTSCGLKNINFITTQNEDMPDCVQIFNNKVLIAEIGVVNKNKLNLFSIKQPVLFADIFWEKVIDFSKQIKTEYVEIVKFPSVHRDLSIVVDKNVSYNKVEEVTLNAKINKLTGIKLFDLFESEKLGSNKKSFAISFTFSDKEKTLTDNEIESMMNIISVSYEKELGAEIRKTS